MKYNILLVKPINKRRYQLTPDFGIGYVAGACLKDGHSVTILDCPKEKMGYEDFERYIKGHQFDVVGFKIFSSEAPEAKKQIEIIRKVSARTIIAVGGPHVSGIPRAAFGYLRPDYLFVGEAEIGVAALLKNNFKKPLESPGLVWEEPDGIKINPEVFAQDVDQFGIPAWDLLNPETYPDEVFGLFVKRFPSIPIITSRGCPFPCAFCAARVTTGSGIRRRTVGLVIKEIRMLMDKYGVRDIGIVDDNFTLSRSYVTDFCNAVIEQKLDISWSCPNGVRLDTLDSSILILMERSGCYSIAVGIESGSPRVLGDMRKHLTVETIKKGVDLIKKNTKIKVTGFFIIGYPTETKEDIEKTTPLAAGLDIDRAAFSIFSPLPGSPIYKELIEEGKIDEDRLAWEKFTIDEAIIPTGAIGSDELKRLQRTAVFRFYLRPKILLNLMREIRSFEQVKIIFKRLLNIAHA